MRFCNGVDENFQHHFVINIGNCFTKIVSRVLLPHKSLHNNRDIFYKEMVLIFFINAIAKPHVKRMNAANGSLNSLQHSLKHAVLSRCNKADAGPSNSATSFGVIQLVQ